MELRIKSWQSVGLRCPDIKVVLIDACGKKGVVSIIQMPNGTGKTTTLELLRAALTGSAVAWPAQKVMDYRSRKNPPEGEFRVDLTVDEVPLVFELSFDFDTQRVLYSTTSPAIGGHREGWEPPPAIRRFLHADFVELVVFDGEFASDLLDRKKTNAERAVDAMSQLYLLDNVRTIAKQEKDRVVKEAGVTGGTQALRQTKNRLEEIGSQLTKVQKAKGVLEKKLSAGREEEKLLVAQFDEEAKQRKGVEEQLGAGEKAVRSAKDHLEAAATETFDAIRIPSLLSKRFAEDLSHLYRGLDSIQLPSSTSKQFFVELSDSEECVCGRPITPDVRETILEKSKSFLGQEHAGVLNAIKTQVQSMVISGSSDAEPASIKAKKLVGAINDLGLATTDLEQLKDSLAAPGGDLAAIRRKLTAVELDNNKHQAMLDEITRPASADDGIDSKCLAALERKRMELEKKEEALTDTVDIGEKTRVIDELAAKVKEQARLAVRRQLVDNGNRLLKSILRQSPVEIESMDTHVKLRSQTNASVGQKLAVGYVMLGGLLNRGAHSLPFIVDSPANPIDNTVRKEVAKTLPNLCDQFITFVISSEKPSFTDVLGEAASAVQYITIFRKLNATEQYLQRLPAEGVSSSEDFVLVEDREFFDAFDVDDQ